MQLRGPLRLSSDERRHKRRLHGMGGVIHSGERMQTEFIVGAAPIGLAQYWRPPTTASAHLVQGQRALTGSRQSRTPRECVESEDCLNRLLALLAPVPVYPAVRWALVVLARSRHRPPAL